LSREARAPREPALVVALTGLITIAPLVPLAAAPAVAAAILVLTLLAWRRRAPAAAALGIFSVVCVVLGAAGIGPQQVVFSAAFAIAAAIVWRVPWLRGATAWFGRGGFDVTLLALCVGIALLSGAALLIWYAIARPDLADLLRTFVPDQPLWLLVPGALLFSMLNAAIEEGAYRGLLLGALDATLGSGHLPVLIQAIAFGALHLYGGFPRGTVGVALAFVYGLLLGMLRRRAGGLLAPWVAHVLTDVAIAGIVLTLVRT
jgi:membrane protease YdiL (CAAX protease family)